MLARALLLASLCLSACGGSSEEASPPAEEEPSAEPAEETKDPSAKAKSKNKGKGKGKSKGKAPQAGTTAELVATLQGATRVAAASAPGEEPSWSKDLTPKEVKLLVQGIGASSPVDGSVPRCLPTVSVTLYDGDDEVGSIGAFCGEKGPMRYALGGRKGSFEAADPAKVDEALMSPVDL